MTEHELLEALRAALPQTDQDALTMVEIATVLGLGKDATVKRIGPLVRSGTMECVRKTVPDITGRPQQVPAYRLAA